MNPGQARGARCLASPDRCDPPPGERSRLVRQRRLHSARARADRAPPPRPCARARVELLRPGQPPRALETLVGDLSGLAPSPDGRTVLVGWGAADQWLLVPLRAGRSARRVTGLAMHSARRRSRSRTHGRARADGSVSRRGSSERGPSRSPNVGRLPNLVRASNSGFGLECGEAPPEMLGERLIVDAALGHRIRMRKPGKGLPSRTVREQRVQGGNPRSGSSTSPGSGSCGSRSRTRGSPCWRQSGAVRRCCLHTCAIPTVRWTVTWAAGLRPHISQDSDTAAPLGRLDVRHASLISACAARNLCVRPGGSR